MTSQAPSTGQQDLSVGDTAPPFVLDSTAGKIALSDLRGQYGVLYFYPKDDTPGCTRESCAFRDALSQFKALHVTVLGVSRDSVESHQKFSEKYDLSFPLLSDPLGEVSRAYGVYRLKTLYGRASMGIVRSTFIIDPVGKIAKIFSPVHVDGHVEAVRAALGGFQKQ